jgi:hypothetical protein
MDPKMRALVEAPLADPSRIYLPEGRGTVRRARPPSDISDETDGGLRLSRSKVAQMKERQAAEKLTKLFDYYAATDLSPERVAEHLGLYRSIQTGTDEKGRPTFDRILDVERAAAQLEWRRKRA